MIRDQQSENAQDVLLEEATYLRRESDDRLRYGHEYGQAGLKGLFLANGGAIIALLTFVGNATSHVDPRGMFWAFVWLSLGLISCLISYFFQYITQDHIMNATHNEAFQKQSDALGWDKKYNYQIYIQKSNCTLKMSVSFGLISLGSFTAGVFVALFAIT